MVHYLHNTLFFVFLYVLDRSFVCWVMYCNVLYLGQNKVQKIDLIAILLFLCPRLTDRHTLLNSWIKLAFGYKCTSQNLVHNRLNWCWWKVVHIYFYLSSMWVSFTSIQNITLHKKFVCCEQTIYGPFICKNCSATSPPQQQWLSIPKCYVQTNACTLHIHWINYMRYMHVTLSLTGQQMFSHNTSHQ